MAKQARDFAAFDSVSAWVILRPDGEECARVHAHHGNSRCTVTVYNWGEGNNEADPQTSSAGGYGYDKLTAAMAGLWIDGHVLTDHCYEQDGPKRPKGGWSKDATPPPGFSFANWGAFDPETGHSVYGPERMDPKHPHSFRPDLLKGWGSCFRKQGLSVLEDFGYRVIQAV